MISLQVVPDGNTDLIMPTFLNHAMPEMFVTLFMLSLLSAAMSTAAAQFHTMGTAIGYDVYQQSIMKGKSTATVHVTRLGITFTILVAVVLAYILPGSIIARLLPCLWAFALLPSCPPCSSEHFSGSAQQKPEQL